MSTNNEVAIAGSSAITTSSDSTIAKSLQGIPRFLLKLYEILNDPGNECMIKWADAGDSFIISDHERFAREVLGKWFKHQNFSSFVRQLNLYGFRKISALQQGLVRSNDESEHIQFAHPYFHRGQPDLLGLIQRKRAPAHAAHAESKGTLGLLSASVPESKISPGEVVDMRSIVEGISAIRRQQQSISNDLNALKQSNDALWKEAIAARERHAKHEDTINRILKFLAGLVGRTVQHGPEHPSSTKNTNVPPKRLLIGDGRQTHGEESDYFGSDAEAHSESGSRPGTPFSTSSDRFVVVDTPDPSAAATVQVTDSIPKSPSILPSIVRPKLIAEPPIMPFVPPPAPENSALPPAASDPCLSVEQWQQFLQAYAQLQQQPQPSFAWTDPSLQLQYPPLRTSVPTPRAVISAPSNGVELNQAALLENAECMNKMYNDTAQINADVDSLQTSIQSFMDGLGLDPQAAPDPNTGAEPDMYSYDPTQQQVEWDDSLEKLFGSALGSGQDDDFSSFLNIPTFEPAAAALSEALPTLPNTASPSGIKRKLESPDELSRTSPNSKKKR
ncbi:uncharacterized protein BXZ73DRAFT_37461 [Epithele typhae]|uniref:uncharacterized protein n=1 Tax=Epithele typhae TaxID=378194 RepID=UPI00200724E6|nr:uncharacterized protein BXZ73DRAFT_37461 [Epithele typhae]KAH9945799.1 hypothetical protein BXZ73DRAFT_37461 [Epithele typhae]